MTRETIKEYILQIKSQDGTEALYNRWEPDILVEVINEIYDDFEEELKKAYIEGGNDVWKALNCKECNNVQTNV